MGEPPGTDPAFGAASPPRPQAGRANPSTEPLPLPVWDTDDERPGGAPAEPHTTHPPAGENPAGPPPPRPGAFGGSADNATQRLDRPYPPADRPSGIAGFGGGFSGPANDAPQRPYPPAGFSSQADDAPQRLDGPHPPADFGGPTDDAPHRLAGSYPPGGFGGPANDAPQHLDRPYPPADTPADFGGPADDVPRPFGGPRLGDPGPWAAPPENATQRLDGPPPPANEPGALGGPPDNATQRLDNPGYDPTAWHQAPAPGPGQEPAPWGTGAPPPPGWDPAGPPPAGPPADGSTAGKKNRRIPLLAGGIAAIVLLGGGAAYLVTQGGSGTKGGTPAAKTQPDASARQAAAVNQVLKSGRTARGHLPGKLRTCDDVSAGVPGFQQVVRDRQQELSQSKNLAVDRLRNGQSLRRSMIAAYQNSLAADQAYLAWAQEVQSRGCGGKIAPLTGHYRAAIAANDKAGPAKRQVVALWRPIADNHGLPTYAWNRL